MIQGHAKRRQPRRAEDVAYRRPRRTRTLHAPSAALLGLLSTIASAECRPFGENPPTYLCPSSIGYTPSSLAPTPTAADSVSSASSASSPSAALSSSSSSSSSSQVHLPRAVPEKFAPGEDGRWRRQSDYTLFGSKFCTGCSTAVDVDDQAYSIDTSSATETPAESTTAATSPDSMPSTLPKGWGSPPASRTSQRTAIIVSLTLGLSFVIVLMMIGCLSWRKKRRKQRERDVERRARRRRREDADDTHSIAQKEARAHKRMWARATARWRANVRHTARQRRHKRTHRVPSSQSSSVDLQEDRQETSHSFSPESRPTSPEPQIVESRFAEPGILTPQEPDIAPTTPIQAPIPSPPAYNLRASVSLPCMPVQTPSRMNTPSNSQSAQPWSSSSQNQVPLSSSFHVAHVATDDKATLARMAEMASAPPEQREQDQPCHVSAPAWYDEPTDFEMHASLPEQTSGEEGALFPPPSSKSAPTLYDYSYRFEDDTASLGEHEPSAPPFEAVPSAPLAEDNAHLEPSAPVLTLEVLQEEEESEYLDDQQYGAQEPESPQDRRHLSANIVSHSNHWFDHPRRYSTDT